MVSEILVKRLLHLRRACAVGGAAAEAQLQKKISHMADRMAGCNVEVAKWAWKLMLALKPMWSLGML